ncbi:hypothetical protein [Janthinobacterium fluminis]|uniref:Uncharacterized protein n=1 Tax=Janthinobacterium fluminis TaxID=2987524 RepID=A0ABT5JWT0_9BURK|nr:hypothetical protein [Janthinobacterium fluminis]MDC8757193.1 hypothetical protein [Janthinobacterium fluminis]
MTATSRRQRGRFSTFCLFMQCFNVAAIVALGVWHGYLFYARAGAPLPLVEIVELRAPQACCIQQN